MMGPGDWRKLENQINGALQVLNDQLAELRKKIEALEKAQAAPKTAPKAKETA